MPDVKTIKTNPLSGAGTAGALLSSQCLSELYTIVSIPVVNIKQFGAMDDDGQGHAEYKVNLNTTVLLVLSLSSSSTTQ